MRGSCATTRPPPQVIVWPGGRGGWGEGHSRRPTQRRASRPPEGARRHSDEGEQDEALIQGHADGRPRPSRALRRGLAPWRQARSRCAAAPSQSRRKRRRQLMCNGECKYIADKPRQKYSETHFNFAGVHIRGCSSQNAFFNAESGMSDFGSTRLQVGDMAPALEWR